MGESNRRFEVEGTSFNPSSGNMLDLGVTSTDEVLSRELNSFLTGEDTGIVESDPKDVKPITKEDKEGDTKEETKEDMQKSLKDGLSEFLSDEEDEEETTTKQDKIKKEPEGKDKPKETKEDEEEEEYNNVFHSLSKDLYKLGVFNHDDDEEEDDPITSADEFLDKFNSEKIKQANEFINGFLGRFGDDYRQAFESIFLKGVNPKDYFASQGDYHSLRDMDLTDINNQKRIFSEYYRRQGMSQEKIEKKLEKAMDLDLLEDEANDLHEILVEQESRHLGQLEEDRAREEHAKQVADQRYSQSIQQILGSKLKEKEFDGIPLTQKEAEETADYMITKKWKLPSGELLSDFDKDLVELKYPDNHELRVKMALLLRRRGDLSKIKQKAISTKSEEIFASTAQLEKTQKRKDPFANSNPSKSFFD